MLLLRPLLSNPLVNVLFVNIKLFKKIVIETDKKNFCYKVR